MAEQLSDLLDFARLIKAKHFAKIISMCPNDIPYMVHENLLPDADCVNCEFMEMHNKFKTPEESKQHCYMFMDKPGEKCGQFKSKA